MIGQVLKPAFHSFLLPAAQQEACGRQAESQQHETAQRHSHLYGRDKINLLARGLIDLHTEETDALASRGYRHDRVGNEARLARACATAGGDLDFSGLESCQSGRIAAGQLFIK